MNAKNELIKILTANSDNKNVVNSIECATIRIDYSYTERADLVDDGFGTLESRVTTRLKTNHSYNDLKTFLNTLDVEYNDGFGTQELFGTVWLKDGTWLSRGEYDGSEWWDHIKSPKKPEYLIEDDEVESLWDRLGKYTRPKKETDVSIQGDDFRV